MKLLFVTQKMDKDDSILGAYHHWVEKLAQKIDKISVICLQRGNVDLPSNVDVFSLGKESGVSRLKYIFRFYRLLWQLRKDYDKVFVHMNPEYIVLAGLFWKLLGKKIIFWYNHPMGGFKARLAIALADVVLHTSPYAFAARFKKAQPMPVGIDMNLFRPHPAVHSKLQATHYKLLYLGRISPIKKLEVLIEAMSILRTSDVDTAIIDVGRPQINLTIVGAPTEGKKTEGEYYEKIKKLVKDLKSDNVITFLPSVPNHEAPHLYNQHEICVNMTPTGSFDKTIIEAMACETLSVASNESARELLPPELMFKEGSVEDLASVLKNIFTMPEEKRRTLATQLREKAAQHHSLDVLISQLIKMLK